MFLLWLKYSSTLLSWQPLKLHILPTCFIKMSFDTKLGVFPWILNVLLPPCLYTYCYLCLECPRWIWPYFAISPCAWINLIKNPRLKLLPPGNLWAWVGIIHPVLPLYLWFSYIFLLLSLMNLHFYLLWDFEFL